MSSALVVIAAIAAHDRSPVPELPDGQPMTELGTTLAPFAYVSHCRRNTDHCESGGRHGSAPRSMAVTETVWRVMTRVNRRINRTASGTDSHAVAQEKRARLLAEGWAPGSLLIAQVRDAAGTEHSVLVVPTNRGDLVLDSRTDTVLPWRSPDYRWIKRQSADNPGRWRRLADFEADRAARGLVHKDRLASRLPHSGNVR